MKRTNFKLLLLCIIIPLAVGGLSALLTKDNMIAFQYIKKPPLTPPASVFPIVWTILYALMGIASYLVITSNAPASDKKSAILFYGLQLIFNFFWSIVFFNLEAYLFAFVWLIILWLLIIVTTVKFYRINKTAGLLLLPYLIWVSFAAYLNYGVYRLNK